jgi:hypothetical protein
MKKSTTLAAALVLPFILASCEKQACTEEGYEATLNLVQDVNRDRCQAWLDGDQRTFECPNERLEGEVAGDIFRVELESTTVSYIFDDKQLELRCGENTVNINTPEIIYELRHRWLEILRELEVD